MLDLDKIYQGDCLKLMPQIDEQSIDMILCDLPYGVTCYAWDKKIPLEKLFWHYKRIIKDHGAIVLTATQPYATDLINAARPIFRYDLIWQKNTAVGFANSHKMPMRLHECILVFYKKLPTYNPQGLKPCWILKQSRGPKGYLNSRDTLSKPHIQKYTNYPKSILEFKKSGKRFHPTEKPLEMFEYLIRTYTNEGDVVVDNCIGSGTTAVACVNTNRHFIGMEMDENYYETAVKRVEDAYRERAIADRLESKNNTSLAEQTNGDTTM